ncbi:monocarboxylate transporter 14 [Patella vulgata]|uniref:monocarboxylate transporter 14 n=1 Tax=Patella vulgata TaxID=6465 RepID=UPI00218080C6|nr:monocarboxylate transporter 14 [Patella vulgata]XP_050408991.1 monocarboxylate transporter 14 [Patella vulgata]XP_055957985.1 monocarboxylate transporter 14 [Patella vulgata]XP_055957986.1 monocarboxylate transporter 14 [Patella vulgata]
MRCFRKCEHCIPDSIYPYILVLITILVYIPVAGLVQSFGIFLEQLNEEFCPNDCVQLLAWVGALALGLNRIFCWVTVILQRFISSFILFLSGVLLCSSGLFISSYFQHIGWMFLTYCIAFGIGSSLVMNSPYSLIEYHFPPSHRYHLLATSIMNVGAPLGSFIMNPIAAYFDAVEIHTWRDTMKIFSLAILVIGLFCSLFIRDNKPSDFHSLDEETIIDTDKTHKNVDEKSSDVGAINNDVMDEKTSIKDDVTDKQDETRGVMSLNNTMEGPDEWRCSWYLLYAVTIWIFAIFLLSFSIYIPKVHFIQYMHSLNIHPEIAALCMSIEGLGEAIFSFLISILGDKIRKYVIYLYAAGCCVLSISSSLLIYATTYYQVAVYCFVHGSMDGIMMSILYPALSRLVSNITLKRYIWAATFFVNGVGQIAGIPLAGMVYDVTKSYNIVFFVAAGVFGSAAILFLLLALKTRNSQ